MTAPYGSADSSPPWGTPGPGDDVDLIVDFLLTRVKRRHHVDLSANQIVHLRLREAAEKAKSELSSAPIACIRVPLLEMGTDGPIHLDTTLTETEFRQITGKPPGPRQPPGPRDAEEPPQPGLQPSPRTTSPPTRTNVVAALVVVLLAGGATGIAWGLSWGLSSLTSSSTTGQATARPDRCVSAVECTPQVVADLVEVVGGTQFVEVHLASDGDASAKAPSAPGATTVERFTWSAGHVERAGPLDEQPRPQALRDKLFDVATVDWASIETLVAQVPQLGGAVVVDRGVSVTVSRSSHADVAEVSLWGMDSGAYVTADFSGRIVNMYGGAPGSPAATWKVAGFYAFVPQVVDDFAASTGSTQFLYLSFVSSYAYAEVQTTPGAKTWERFEWNDGVVQSSAFIDASAMQDPLSDILFDVTAVDWTVAGRLAAQMPTMTLAPSDVEYGIEKLTLEVRRPKSDQERRATTEVVFVFEAESDSTATTIVTDATGKIVWMEGGAPGSPAAKWAADHP
ncbi:MAG: Hsp70 family protein [Micrococcales bacterium]|nr:Hsp70 family protein [Micrococcales bacterium]MCL2667745.1 Hsp70 family protein [Micrococcales bacterium]